HRGAIDRRMETELPLDHLAHPAATRFGLSRIRLNLDRLSDLADLQSSVDGYTAVDLQEDAGLHKRTKACQSGFQPVGTERQTRQYIESRFIRNGRSGDSCFRLRRRDFDA